MLIKLQKKKLKDLSAKQNLSGKQTKEIAGASGSGDAIVPATTYCSIVATCHAR